MKALSYVYAVIYMLILSILISIPAYLFIQTQTQEKIDLYFNSQLHKSAIEFKATTNSFSLVSQSVFDNSINKEDILSLIKQANKADEKEKARLRRDLYIKLLPLYENLNNQNIRQLHFHLKNSVSFLRFYRPEKFGDSLEGVRYSINKVNRTFKPEHGFEEGRVFNGFRHVYPLIYQNKFTGTVEISYSFNAIRAEQSKLSEAAFNFIMNKEVTTDKVWKSELHHYKTSSLSPQYLQDTNNLKQPLHATFNDEEIEIINTNIAPQATEKLKTRQQFLIPTQLHGKDVLVMFIPILNVENNQVAYFIAYTYDSVLDLIQQTHKIECIASCLMAVFVSVLLVLYVLSHKRTAKALELLATTDPLTNIANRNKLNMILEKSIHLSQRYKLPLSVIFFDIDHFKKINDHHGHEAGDTVLSSIASLISNHIRQSDTFARWGGEEFIILLPETEHDKAYMLAERFRKIIAEYKFLPDVEVTCSFGVTQLHHDDDESSLLKRVDDALYKAKGRGRNKVIKLA